MTGAQTTLDPKQMKEWTPNSRYGGHAFGIFKKVKGRDVADFAQFLVRRDEILPWIAEYSPYALLTADDPPVYLIYRRPPALGQEEKDPTHTANFGRQAPGESPQRGSSLRACLSRRPGRQASPGPGLPDCDAEESELKTRRKVQRVVNVSTIDT